MFRHTVATHGQVMRWQPTISASSFAPSETLATAVHPESHSDFSGLACVASGC